MDNRYKGLGIASMVFGVVSILLWGTILISGLCAVVGAAVGVYYLSKRKQEPAFAIAGIATSALGIVILFVKILVFIYGFVALAIATMQSEPLPEEEYQPYYEEQMPYFEEQPYGDFFEDYGDFFYDGGEDDYTDSF